MATSIKICDDAGIIHKTLWELKRKDFHLGQLHPQDLFIQKIAFSEMSLERVIAASEFLERLGYLLVQKGDKNGSA